MGKGGRLNIVLTCTKCRNRNYITTINPKLNKEKISRNKFCKFCRLKQTHIEKKNK